MTVEQVEKLKQSIREVPDFPRPGINFYDVCTLFRDGGALRDAVRGMADAIRDRPVDVLAGIEARGFVLGSAIAYELGLGIVLVRKFGKLPGATESESYDLEYGSAHIEIQSDAIEPGSRVLVVDDLLATGGTAGACGRLIERLGGRLDGFAFLVELEFLAGRAQLEGHDVFSLLTYR